MFRKSFTLRMSLLLALGLGACTSQAMQGGGALEPPITETRWRLTELMGERVTLTKYPYIVMRKDGRYEGFGGCNRIAGSYELKAPNRIRLTKGVTTMMACIRGMEEEALLVEMLGRADSYAIHDGRLQLHRARMAPLAVFEASEAE